MSITCAVMVGDVVNNVIVVDNIEQSTIDLGVELIEYNDDKPAGIGWTYDRANNKFIAPENQRPKIE